MQPWLVAWSLSPCCWRHRPRWTSRTSMVSRFLASDISLHPPRKIKSLPVDGPEIVRDWYFASSYLCMKNLPFSSLSTLGKSTSKEINLLFYLCYYLLYTLLMVNHLVLIDWYFPAIKRKCYLLLSGWTNVMSLIIVKSFRWGLDPLILLCTWLLLPRPKPSSVTLSFPHCTAHLSDNLSLQECAHCIMLPGKGKWSQCVCYYGQLLRSTWPLWMDRSRYIYLHSMAIMRW